MAKLIPIIGRKNQGKTTLVLKLIDELMARGHQVGSIKHTSHHHEFDQKGKDSQRQRAAGAQPVAVVSATSAALFWEHHNDLEALKQVESHFQDCEFILMEGWKHMPGPKIEVWRNEEGGSPLYVEIDHVVLVAGHPTENIAAEVIPLDSTGEIADFIIEQQEIFNDFA